ncbi:MAG TPA: sulfatase-like hydrolase/transferase, partial [Prolixibacteraceae bacterium]|nr:sulfatase-like hydrolase/transferase [Prolixibacteraceae bacterium]
MFRKKYSSILGLFLSVLFMSCQPGKEQTKPNILLISVDDMGWSDIGCYGSEINTPNIDRMAEGGMRFRNFYNSSKCFPSRACLITGVYAQDCGYAETHKNPITNAVTIGEVLQNAGYLTYWSGKHHGLENPYERGFDHYYGLKDGACNHFNPGKKRKGEPKPAQKRKNRFWAIDSVIHQPYTPDHDFYTTDRFTDYALRYIDEAVEKQK